MDVRKQDLAFSWKNIANAESYNQMSNGQFIYPQKGTNQDGIISPILSNIVLNTDVIKDVSSRQLNKRATANLKASAL